MAHLPVRSDPTDPRPLVFLPNGEAVASASVGAPFAIISRMTERRFPPPWSVEKIPGGLKVCDANGQLLALGESESK